MTARVHFNSNMFRELDFEHEQSRSEIIGKELALWIRENLPKHGTKTNEVIAEDTGWIVTIPSDHCAMTISCSNENNTTDQWECSIEYEVGIFEKIFDHVNLKQQVDHVTHSLDHLLHHSNSISNITWEAR